MQYCVILHGTKIGNNCCGNIDKTIKIFIVIKAVSLIRQGSNMTIHAYTSFASVGLAPIFRPQTHSLTPKPHPAHISLPACDTGSDPH